MLSPIVTKRQSPSLIKQHNTDVGSTFMHGKPNPAAGNRDDDFQ